MITPENQSAQGAPTQSVPLEALSLDGIPPAAGDEVNFNVSGIVTSVDERTAEVQVSAINDQPVGNPADDMLAIAEEADAEVSPEDY